MILIIDHFDSFSHNLAQLLGGLGYEVLVRRCDKLSLDDAQGMSADAIVLSPGPRGPADTGITPHLLASNWAQSTTIIGICLGLQAMGVHWGATVTNASEVVHGKTILLPTSPHPLFAGLGPSIAVARYHSLCITCESLTGKADIISSYDGMVMVAQDQRTPWLGLQFHPESFLTPDGPTLMRNALHHLDCLR